MEGQTPPSLNIGTSYHHFGGPFRMANKYHGKLYISAYEFELLTHDISPRQMQNCFQMNYYIFNCWVTTPAFGLCGLMSHTAFIAAHSRRHSPLPPLPWPTLAPAPSPLADIRPCPLSPGQH